MDRVNGGAMYAFSIAKVRASKHVRVIAIGVAGFAMSDAIMTLFLSIFGTRFQSNEAAIRADLPGLSLFTTYNQIIL